LDGRTGTGTLGLVTHVSTAVLHASLIIP